MTVKRNEQLLQLLAQSSAWLTAGDLADKLGVTTRSVRGYVAAINAKAKPDDPIESSRDGYRLRPNGYAQYRALVPPSSVRGGPQFRIQHIVRRLANARDGVDVYQLAEDLFVSDSTVESDLAQLRALLVDTELAVIRTGSLVRITGDEASHRRLLGRLFRAEMADGFLDLGSVERTFAATGLRSLKSALLAELDERGYFVNEYGINDVLLHVAIAVDRVSRGRVLATAERSLPAPTPTGLAALLGELTATHLGLDLGTAELNDLTFLLTSRVVTTRSERVEDIAADNAVSEHDVMVVRAIVANASTEYLVDLNDENFILRLAVHVRNLILRSRRNSHARNPLTRSIKTSYPMTYELAVFVSTGLQREYSIEVTEDEIAFVAMHIGALLVQQSCGDEILSCTLLCPAYYDIHALTGERLRHAFGGDLTFTPLITRGEIAWNDIDSDLVLTTITPPLRSDRIVVIHPFPTDGDIELVREAVRRIRRDRRRSYIKSHLLTYFEEDLFFRNVYADDEAAMIELLGSHMMRAGVIDADYVSGSLERERMSSTAFADMLAVPHAMSMTASRTLIAIVVNDTPMSWGESRVNVIAFIAFSESGRQEFQQIFDQFVEVFSERESVLSLIRRAERFTDFIEELARMIGS